MINWLLKIRPPSPIVLAAIEVLKTADTSKAIRRNHSLEVRPGLRIWLGTGAMDVNNYELGVLDAMTLRPHVEEFLARMILIEREPTDE